MFDDDHWYDGPADDEYPDESDYPDDDESLTQPCPACGADVYEDAEQCPVCGEYITWRTGDIWAGRSIGWIVLGLLGILATILVLSGLTS